MKKQLIVTILLTTCLFIAAGTLASPKIVSRPTTGGRGSWKLLGTVSAKRSADHDQIIVVGPHNYFKRLKFKVTHSPITLNKILVRYDDGGTPEVINTRYQIPKGRESQEIDLRGSRRKLNAVEFWYDTKGLLNGKADLTLFGIK